jgi:hypothetical protein
MPFHIPLALIANKYIMTGCSAAASAEPKDYMHEQCRTGITSDDEKQNPQHVGHLLYSDTICREQPNGYALRAGQVCIIPIKDTLRPHLLPVKHGFSMSFPRSLKVSRIKRRNCSRHVFFTAAFLNTY